MDYKGIVEHLKTHKRVNSVMHEIYSKETTAAFLHIVVWFFDCTDQVANQVQESFKNKTL